jgi:ribonuclease T
MSGALEQHDDGGEDDAPKPPSAIAGRFRGFLPVIVDVETGGFIAATDALLEVAAVIVRFDAAGDLQIAETFRYLVKPFPGSRLDPASLQVTGIDPFHPLRPALDETEALRRLFQDIRKEVKEQGCNRAVLVGHNASFDLQFIEYVGTHRGLQWVRIAEGLQKY